MKKNANPSVGLEGDWRAESDMRSLVEAEAIKRDPKRLAAAQACAKKKLEEVAAVTAMQPAATAK